MSAGPLVEHFFRHEYGRLVAMLCRRVGPQHVEAVEDAVQGAMMAALESWPIAGLPDAPAAWLFQAARNELISTLRQRSRRRSLLEQHALDTLASVDESAESVRAADADDAMLRMLFVCCDDAIPMHSQVVLALKMLCGFDVREIARCLFVAEPTVYKRLERARSRLQSLPLNIDTLTNAQMASRVTTVRQVLYQLFSEGYFSCHAEHAVRVELCREAMRLTTLLAEHPLGADAETFALLALMHMHAARITSRVDASGGLVLLEEQDRANWDQAMIAAGMTWLARSAHGDVFSRYHAEAGIATEHCVAASFGETNWERIVECYQLLEHVAPSPIHTLNRAVAVAEWKGAAAGLAVLDGFTPPKWLETTYQFAAVLADLHRRSGSELAAARYRTLALKTAPTPAIQRLLAHRLTDTTLPGEH